MEHSVLVRRRIDGADHRTVVDHLASLGGQRRARRGPVAERAGLVGGCHGGERARDERKCGSYREGAAETPVPLATRPSERSRRVRLERSLAERRSRSPDLLSPRGAVRAEAKMRLKSADAQLMQLAIEVSRD
jgi:hypothetical protein